MNPTIQAILQLKDQLSGPMRAVGGTLVNTAKAVNDINNGLHKAASNALGLKSHLASALGAVGVGIGFKEILDLSSNFEDTALSIAGNIKAFNLAPTFEESREAASDALELIDTMAAKLPGEADQYIQVFKTALPKAIESGLGSIKEVADFTSKYTAVAVSNQIDAMQAGMDLMRMLGGQAGLDVRTWQALNPHLKVTDKILKELGGKAKGLAVGAGLTAEMFNKLSATTRRELIEGAIGKFDEQLTAAGDTFSAKMGELTSRVKKLIRLASEPMFEAAKDALSKINEYLEENGDKIKAQVEDFFKMATEYIPQAVDGLKYLLDHAKEIKDAMVTAMELWIASSTLNALNNVLGIFKALATQAKIIGAIQLGTGGGMGPSMTLGTRLASWGRMGLGYAGRALSSVAGATATAAAAGAGVFLYSSNAGDEMELSKLADIREKDREKREKEAQKIRKDREREMMGGELDTGGLAGIVSPEFLKKRKADADEKARKAAEKAAKTPSGRSQTFNDFRNSRFDIKQMFSEGFDPDRIAVAFASDLARVGEMKLQAARNLQSGMVR